MKLSQNTIDIIKNFSTINQGMLFKEGKVLKTVSPHKNILAVANIEDKFDKEFAIYDLNHFLSVVTLAPEREINFDEEHVVVNSSYVDDGIKVENEIKFRFSTKNMIVSPPEKDIQFPEPEIHLNISSKVIDSILRYASVLASPHISVFSDGKDVFITAIDTTGGKTHTGRIKFAPGNGDTYNLHFKIDSLLLYPGDYELHISSAGVSHWKNKTTDIQYWITVEPGSTYQKG